MMVLNHNREKEFKDCGVKMVAEKVEYGRYVEPIFWTRYHLYVVSSSFSLKEGGNKSGEIFCHYGFDSDRTADLVWDELVKRLEECQDKLTMAKAFRIDSIDLAGCEGRIIKYMDGGKMWSVFPPKARLR